MKRPISTSCSKVSATRKAARRLRTLSPGEMLREEFLGPMELTPYRLAKDIGMPLTRITAILAGKRAITADTGLRLDRYFGLSEGWWLRLQTECDIRTVRRTLASELAAITPRQAA